MSLLYDRREFLALAGAALIACSRARADTMPITSPIIDDLNREPPLATIGTSWRMFTDRVMGGVSDGTMSRELVASRQAIRMRGDVSLENNGGFVQISLDLDPDGKPVDVSSWSGLELDVYGNGETYAMHLRTADLRRPWQSYRQSFRADPEWRTVELPFKDFVAHRTDVGLNTRRLKRVGIVAIGRPFVADVSVGGVRLVK
jgi:hypothetical protein